MKNILIVVAVIVGIILFMFRDVITLYSIKYSKNTAKTFFSGTPEQVEKIAQRYVKLKYSGHYLIPVEMVIKAVSENPNPEVLKTVLDNEDVQKVLKERLEYKGDIDAGLFIFISRQQNAPEKVKILLKHGFDPYKPDYKFSKSAVEYIKKMNYNSKVVDVIDEYYGY